MSTNELYHYGILGQKWGIRRFQNEDGSLTAAGKARYAENTAGKDARIAAAKEKKVAKATTGYKKASEMTNEELSDFVKRIDNEKKYNEWIKSQSTEKQSLGKKFAKQLAEDSVKSISSAVTGAVSSVVRSELEAAIRKQLHKNDS